MSQGGEEDSEDAFRLLQVYGDIGDQEDSKSYPVSAGSGSDTHLVIHSYFIFDFATAFQLPKSALVAHLQLVVSVPSRNRIPSAQSFFIMRFSSIGVTLIFVATVSPALSAPIYRDIYPTDLGMPVLHSSPSSNVASISSVNPNTGPNASGPVKHMESATNNIPITESVSSPLHTHHSPLSGSPNSAHFLDELHERDSDHLEKMFLSKRMPPGYIFLGSKLGPPFTKQGALVIAAVGSAIASSIFGGYKLFRSEERKQGEKSAFDGWRGSADLTGEARF
ncbi:hypothetical protein BC835DRAFT_1420514 [Cytidiella melzeri]|nr:hypothetical protein BC835DRAFT_1420514 [Cytidiella melzeri]